MARLSTEARKHLKTSQFAGEDRTYPIEDKAHARNAKARASQAERAGRISEAEKARIDAKADRKLGEKGTAMESKKAERRGEEHAVEKKAERKAERRMEEKHVHHEVHHHVHHHGGEMAKKPEMKRERARVRDV